MSVVTEKVFMSERRKKFGNLDEAILKHIDDSGLVYYFYNARGEKIYGLPVNAGVTVLSETYTGVKTEVQQQFKDDCDINLILKKYGIDRVAPESVQIPVEHFRDVSATPKDLTAAYNLIRESEEMFYELPAELRRAVNDDPRRLMELAQSENGIKELQRLGFGLPPEAPISDSKALERPPAEPKGKQAKAAKTAVKESDEGSDEE